MNWAQFTKLHKDAYCFELKMRTPKGKRFELRNFFEKEEDTRDLVGVAMRGMEVEMPQLLKEHFKK